MLTDEDLPPSPKFKVAHWAFTGIMAWSLFFGVVGGLAILLLADYGPEKISPTHRLKENVASVDSRVAALEQQVQNEKHDETPQAATQAGTQASVFDIQLAKIAVGLTQLKSAYDNDVSLKPGIETLKHSINNNVIQQDLDRLEKMTNDNLPSKAKILDDLQTLQNARGAPKPPEDNKDQNNGWRDRAKFALSQLVRVTPTKNIIGNQQIDRVQQAVTAGDFNLAQKFAAQLPSNEATQNLLIDIRARAETQNLVQSVIGQISSAIGQATGQGSLY